MGNPQPDELSKETRYWIDDMYMLTILQLEAFRASGDVFTIGAGYLDISGTVSAALVNGGSVPAGSAMSPIAVYNSVSEQTTATVDPSALWTVSRPWSASSVYGSNTFISSDQGSTALWGKTALRGKNDPDGYTALWGKTAL
jgi:hypothetical protein